jgi:hypothetical protein
VNRNKDVFHLFTFQTPILTAKKIKKRKINSRNFTYDGLTFSSSGFILEEVKDEICVTCEKHNGRSCFSIQQLVSFIMFMEEFASLVLNTIFLFSQLTQSEHFNRLEGLKYEKLKENIKKVISEIPKEKYENIFKGAYERPEKYVPKNKTRKITKIYK